MVGDPRSRAGERTSELALLTLASRSEPSLHSPCNAPNPLRLTLLTDDCPLCTRRSLPATRVSWEHFALKMSHYHRGRKHGRCSTRQRLKQCVQRMRQSLVALAGSRGREANRQRAHTTCSRGRRQRQMAPQNEGIASWSCLQSSTLRHDGPLLRRARCQLRPCDRSDSISNRLQCFSRRTLVHRHQRCPPTASTRGTLRWWCARWRWSCCRACRPTRR